MSHSRPDIAPIDHARNLRKPGIGFVRKGDHGVEWYRCIAQVLGTHEFSSFLLGVVHAEILSNRVGPLWARSQTNQANAIALDAFFPTSYVGASWGIDCGRRGLGETLLQNRAASLALQERESKQHDDARHSIKACVTNSVASL